MQNSKSFVYLSLRGVFPNRERLRRSNLSLNNLSFVFFLSVLPAFLWADPPLVEPAANTATAQVPVSLTEVVVTASRLDMPASQVPNSLTVITAQDIEKKQAGTVNQALQNVPGFDVAQWGGPGEITSTFLRGGGDEATLVMMDGIPLNDPIATGRSYDYLDSLSLGGVDRIEVVRGPQSVLYGSNAMAGVVNIVTRRGATGPTTGTVLAEGGSYGTVRQAASVAGGGPQGDYLLSASYFGTAGFPSAEKAFGNSLNNPYSGYSSFLKLGAAPVSNLREEVLVNYNQSRINTDDGAGSSFQPMPVMDDPNYWIDQKQVLVGSRTSLNLGNWEQSLTLSFGDNNRYFNDSQNPAYPFSSTFADQYDGQTAQVTWHNSIETLPGKTLLFGLQGTQEWGYESALYSGMASPPLEASQWSESAYLGVLLNQDGRFFLNAGDRVDNNNAYGVHSTYQAGAAYFVPGLETKLKANYGTGFVAPSLYQLYAAAPTGNSSLQPETSTGYDFGFEQPLAGNALRLGAAYFHNDFENLIIFVGPFGSGQYQNSSSFQTQGVEATLDLRVAQVLTLKGSYTYTEVETDIPATQDNSPLLHKPANQAGVDLDYQSGPVEAGVSASYVGVRPDFDFYYPPPAYASPVGPVTLAEYYLVNLRASFQVDEHVKLYARVDNLFNQFYEQVYGYGTPGLSAYGGTKISF